MRRYHHLVEGVLQPEEIDTLQKIFDVVIAQPWFDLNDVSREAFAAELIKLYRRGVIDYHKLHDLAALTALAQFSRDMPEERRRGLLLLYEARSDLAGRQRSGTYQPKHTGDDRAKS